MTPEQQAAHDAAERQRWAQQQMDLHGRGKRAAERDSTVLADLYDADLWRHQRPIELLRERVLAPHPLPGVTYADGTATRADLRGVGFDIDRAAAADRMQISPPGRPLPPLSRKPAAVIRCERCREPIGRCECP